MVQLLTSAGPDAPRGRSIGNRAGRHATRPAAAGAQSARGRAHAVMRTLGLSSLVLAAVSVSGCGAAKSGTGTAAGRGQPGHSARDICGSSVFTDLPGQSLSVIEATKSGIVNVSRVGDSGTVLLMLSSNCDSGAQVDAAPGGHVVITYRVLARDGSVVAVVAAPRAQNAELKATRAGAAATLVRFRLPEVPPCRPPVC